MINVTISCVIGLPNFEISNWGWCLLCLALLYTLMPLFWNTSKLSHTHEHLYKNNKLHANYLFPAMLSHRAAFLFKKWREVRCLLFTTRPVFHPLMEYWYTAMVNTFFFNTLLATVFLEFVRCTLLQSLRMVIWQKDLTVYMEICLNIISAEQLAELDIWKFDAMNNRQPTTLRTWA